MTETNRNSRTVLYFDPNETDDNLDIMKPLEDYSIAIDLEVDIPSRDNYTDRETYTLSWKSKSGDKEPTAANFLRGSKIGGSNVLTTFYTDLNFDYNNPVENPEAIGISSIDIDYDSWYLPKVTIKFVDLRGGALFNSAQFSHDNDEVSNNLFRAFFTIPYPLFKLRVKGFYGDAITLPLYLIDFRAEFNSSTGDFEIITQFVGYTYAFLADTPFNFLKTAPYNKVYGKDYWSTQVENGTFCLLDENNNCVHPMPTLVELTANIAKAQEEVGKLMSTDEDVNAYERNKKDRSILLTISNLWNEIIRKIDGEHENKVISYESNDSVIKFVADGENVFNINKDDIKNITNDLKEKIKRYNDEVDDVNTDTLPEIKLEIKKTLLTEIEADNIWVEKIKNDDILKEKISDKTYYYELNNSNFWSKLKTLDEDKLAIIKVSKQNISNKIEEMVVANIGFRPTINNVFRIIFAHLETFMKGFYEVLDEISNSERTVSDYFNDAKETDVNTNDINSTFLSPFPGTYDSDGTEIWIGRLNPKMEEVKYVYSTIEAVNEARKIEKGIMDSISEINQERDYWLPINPYDTFLTNKRNVVNPYSRLVSTEFRDVVINMGLRMFYGLSTYSNTLSSGRVNEIAKLEAQNILNSLGGNKSIMNKFNRDDIVNVLMEILQSTSEEYPMTTYTFPDAIKRNGEYVTSVISNSSNNTTSLNFLKNTRSANGYSILPMYVDSFSKLKNDWYCDGIVSVATHDGLPFITNNSLSNNDVATSKTFFSIHENIDEFIEYKEVIDKIDASALTNWYLEVKDVKTYFNNSVNLLFDRDYSEPRTTKKKHVYLKEIYKEDDNVLIDKIDNSKHNWFENYRRLDREIKGRALIRGREDDLKMFYPTLNYGYDKIDVSVFGSMFYYAQNDYTHINTLGDKAEEVSNLAKATIFLTGFDVRAGFMNRIFENKTNYTKRIPKIVLLKLGSLLWRFKYAMEKDKDPIYFPDGYYTAPTNKYTYLEEPIPCIDKNTDDFLLFRKKKVSKYKNFNEVFTNIVDKNNNFILKEPIINEIINYFITWANDKNGFKTIQNNLELKLKKDDGKYVNLTSDNIRDKVEEYKEKLDNKKLYIKNYHDDFGDNFFANYIKLVILSDEKNKRFGFLLEHRAYSKTMDVINKLILEDVVVVNTHYEVKNTSNNVDFKLPTSQVRSYLTTLTDIIKDQMVKNSPEINNEDVTVFNNDAISLGIYRNLKNLYDKWCASKQFQDFTVDNFYKPRFKFIDKFYNDISNDLIINVETFYDIMLHTYTNETTNLYSVLSELLSKHEMLFIPSASNVNWVQDEKTLKNIFRPIPFAEHNTQNSEPGFTGIYIGQPSSNLAFDNSKNKMANDALIAYPEENFPNKDDDIPSFPVPCFSVSYGKQNQSYFTDFTVGMNNPVNTEQALQSIYNLSQRGGGNNRIAQGQELYKIYTRNSYQVTANMLGCAQIQPMMYFQLNNIPLFKGCYMIYRVNHKITPGDMKTSFTGMRMSRIAPMYTKEPFIFKSFLADFDDSDLVSTKIKSAEEMNVDTEQKKLERTIQDGERVRKSESDFKDDLERNKTKYGNSNTIGLYVEDNLNIDYVNYQLLKNQEVSKHFTLRDFVEESGGNASKGKTFDDAGGLMPYRVYENILMFALQLDRIVNWFNTRRDSRGELISKTQTLKFTSLWRVKWNGTKENPLHRTHHGLGSAADIQILNKGGSSKNKDSMLALFNFIREDMENNISQLLFEESQTNTNSFWVHYAYNPNAKQQNYIVKNFPAP